jgi:hypothetical protein
MSDDKKIIFSMVGVSKTFAPQKKVLNNISTVRKSGLSV